MTTLFPRLNRKGRIGDDCPAYECGERCGGGAPGRAKLVGVKSQVFTCHSIEGGFGVGHDAAGDQIGLGFGEALGLVDEIESGLFFVGPVADLDSLLVDLVLVNVALGAH